jgi:hypothetical protein
MEQMIAYCGLDCAQCGAYLATQANDPAALQRVADEWRVAHNWTDCTAEDVICNGCHAEGRRCSHCARCEIRECGVQHAVETCAHCAEFESCARIAAFIEMVPPARANLMALRARL